MQYCSLQHQTLLSPPDTSIIKNCFCFGPAASFFLELLLIVLGSSPGTYWTSSELGPHFPVSYLFAFSYCSLGSHGKNTGVGFHFLLPWNLPDPEIEPWSPTLQADALISEPPGKLSGGFFLFVCLFVFYHKWILNFVKGFLCIY